MPHRNVEEKAQKLAKTYSKMASQRLKRGMQDHLKGDSNSKDDEVKAVAIRALELIKEKQ